MAPIWSIKGTAKSLKIKPLLLNTGDKSIFSLRTCQVTIGVLCSSKIVEACTFLAYIQAPAWYPQNPTTSRLLQRHQCSPVKAFGKFRHKLVWLRCAGAWRCSLGSGCGFALCQAAPFTEGDVGRGRQAPGFSSPWKRRRDSTAPPPSPRLSLPGMLPAFNAVACLHLAGFFLSFREGVLLHVPALCITVLFHNRFTGEIPYKLR